MRMTPPSHSVLKCWARFDGYVRESLNRILGSNLTEQQWVQAQLPVAMGGTGLRSPAEHSSAAYLGSYLDSESRIHQVLEKAEYHLDPDRALGQYSTQVGEPEPLDIAQLAGEGQKVLSLRVDMRKRDVFIETLETGPGCCLLAFSMQEAG